MKKTLLFLVAAAFQLVSWGQSGSVEAQWAYVQTDNGNYVRVPAEQTVANVKKLPKKAVSNVDGAEFTAKTTEGIEMKFKIISAKNKTCQVGIRGNVGYVSGEFVAVDTKTKGKVTIPSKVEGYTVVSIAGGAFYNCRDITEVIIPQTVMTIERMAFCYCNGLTAITIPKSVIDVVSYAFSQMRNLSSIKVESGNVVYDSRDNCNAIIETESNKLVVGCNTTVIPKTIVQIDGGAFSGSGIQSITIPKNVSSIYSSPFNYCTSLSKITVESGNPVYDSRDNCNAIIETASNKLVSGTYTTVIPASVTTIGISAFQGQNLEDIAIPEGINTIMTQAFCNCTNLKSVTLPSTLLSLGKSVFSYSLSLKEVTAKMAKPITIQDDVFSTSYRNSKGEYCYPETLKVPKGTKSLYAAAENWNQFGTIIEGDEAAVEPTTEEPVIEYKDGDTFEAPTVEGVKMKFKVISAKDKTCQVGWRNDSDHNPYNNAFVCVDLNTTGTITIPAEVNGLKVVKIADIAFRELQISKLIIPSTVQIIGSQGIAFLPNLEEIFIPASVVEFRGYGICHNYGLKKIVVDSANTIYDSRDNCNAIIRSADNTLVSGCVTTTIPSTVKAIDSYAFLGCRELRTMVIPKNIVSIADGAFSYCNLETLSVEEGNTVYDSRENCGAVIETATNKLVCGSAKMFIPESVVCLGDMSIMGNDLLKEVIIPASIKSIGVTTLYFCPNLNKVTSLIRDSIEVFAKLWGANFINNYVNNEPVYPEYLYVPKGTKEAYMAADIWKNFSNIVEMEPETFSESGVTYEISAEAEVAFVGDASAKSSYEIPATVSHDGKEYKVTAIAADAFKGDEALTSVMIPEGVDVIGARAFAGCKNLADIFVKAEKPATIAAALSRGLIHKASGQTVDTFDGVDKTTCVLHVLAQSLELYRQAEGWKEFQHIVAFDPVGISNTSAAATSFDVYTTAGVLVRQQTTTSQGLPAGVYIVNGRKMVVK